MKQHSPELSRTELFKILQKNGFDKTASTERQLATHVRELIVNGDLPPLTRLPPIRFLTELWGITFFAIQLAFRRLASEGLLTQSPKRGTFVTPLRRKLRHICLYHNSDLRNADEFYAQLNLALYRQLSERAISATSYFDTRPMDDTKTVPPEIYSLVQGREVDAVIASSILPAHTPWLRRLGVPVASPLWKEFERDISIDLDAFIDLAMKEVVRQKRKTIGLIYPPPIGWTDQSEVKKRKPRKEEDRFLKTFKAKAREHKITVLHSVGNHPKERHWEEYALMQCEELFAAPVRPDVLIVYPDSLVRGVFSYLIAHRISVPESVLVISHRNKEVSIYAPFPVIWLTVKIEDFARLLLGDIDQQMEGRRELLAKIPITLEESK